MWCAALSFEPCSFRECDAERRDNRGRCGGALTTTGGWRFHLPLRSPVSATWITGGAGIAPAWVIVGGVNSR